MKENTPTSVLDPQPVGWASILRAGKHRVEKNGLEQMEAEEHASMTLLHSVDFALQKLFALTYKVTVFESGYTANLVSIMSERHFRIANSLRQRCPSFAPCPYGANHFPWC